MLTDETGTPLERYEYGEFGAPTFFDGGGSSIGATAYGNRYLFNGREYDSDTGLYHYRTRYMDPQAGRFISRDTIGLYGDPSNLGNGQAYVGNNPWSRLDPFGEQESLSEYYLSRGFAQIAEFFTGVRETELGGEISLPQDGPGGLLGGTIETVTLNLVPAESQPSPLSAAGIDTGADLVPFLGPAMRLGRGRTASGLPASRVLAGGELAVQAVPFMAAEIRILRAGTKSVTLTFDDLARIDSFANPVPRSLGAAARDEMALLATQGAVAPGMRLPKGGTYVLRDPNTQIIMRSGQTKKSQNERVSARWKCQYTRSQVRDFPSHK